MAKAKTTSRRRTTGTKATGGAPKGRANRHARVVVVGGGLAGLTMAARLGALEIDTLVVDRLPRPARSEITYDGRTTAISMGSRRILGRAGVWDAMASGAEPITDIRIADDRQPFLLHFDHDEMAEESGGAPFGHIVDNRAMRLALFDAVDGLDGVDQIAPAQVTGIDRDGPIAALTLDDGRRLTAELIIGADGRGSFVRQECGISARQWTYDQKAIVCAFTHQHPHDGLALEHFMPEGPFAVLPMRDDDQGRPRSSLVWTERPARADALLAMDVAGFEAALHERLGDYLGQPTLATERFCYPLGVLHADSYIARRTALIGEAAHGIHPIAGQGLNLSLRDVDRLGDLIAGRARLGLDVGDDGTLRRYERARRPDNTAMLMVTDGLNRLFSNHVPALKPLRGVGLEVVGGIPPLKRFFMRQAMGLSAR